MLTPKMFLKNLLGSTGPRHQIWRISYLILLGALMTSAIYTIQFVYENVYGTLNNTYAIIQISPNLEADALNLPLFEKTQQIILAKQSPLDIPTNLRNIFEYGAASTTTIVTTTMKK